MYTIAAIWNWVLAISFLILPRIDINNFYLAGDTIPPTMIWFDSFMGMVFLFGIGFYFVSRSTEKNHDFIKIACIEKVWVFIVPLYYVLIGEAALLVLVFVTVDLIFGFLFMEDLRAITRE
jgi:hypothetical protein